MDTKISFNFGNQPISVIKDGDDMQFQGKSMTKALGYINTKYAIVKHVDTEFKIKYGEVKGVMNCDPLVTDP